MNHHKHLTITERESIMVLSYQGVSISETARSPGKARSAMSRELRYNTTDNVCSAHHAQKTYEERRKKCGAHKKPGNPELKKLVKSKFLDQQWSPQPISERMKLEGSEWKISYNTIYRGIYAGEFNEPEVTVVPSESFVTEEKAVTLNMTKNGGEE